MSVSPGGKIILGSVRTDLACRIWGAERNLCGASGNASFGLGLGANVLVGGSHRTISLQPLSVEGQFGVNLTLGVARLTLR